MRASPAFQVSIRHFGVWQGAVGLLLAAAVAATATWLATSDRHVGRTLFWASALVSITLVAIAARHLLCVPASLRWDGQQWHLGRLAERGDEPLTGTLQVLIDLGPWLLLRFVSDGMNGRVCAPWLPVQRQGLEAHWHALRCAVYSSRPSHGHDRGLVQRSAENHKNERT